MPRRVTDLISSLMMQLPGFQRLTVILYMNTELQGIWGSAEKQKEIEGQQECHGHQANNLTSRYLAHGVRIFP